MKFKHYYNRRFNENFKIFSIIKKREKKKIERKKLKEREKESKKKGKKKKRKKYFK